MGLVYVMKVFSTLQMTSFGVTFITKVLSFHRFQQHLYNKLKYLFPRDNFIVKGVIQK